MKLIKQTFASLPDFEVNMLANKQESFVRLLDDDEQDIKYSILLTNKEFERLGSGFKVIAVLKNADITEGKGPMLLDKVFKGITNAFKYVEAQKGTYGSEQRLSIGSGVNCYNEGYIYNCLNGFDIKLIALEDA